MTLKELQAKHDELQASLAEFQALEDDSITAEMLETVQAQAEEFETVKADLKAMLDPQTVKEKKITPAEGITFDAPYYDLEGKVVWGATAMMLSEFVTLTKSIYGQ